ncbi:PREDICTED: binding partner of ACD11 1-like [Ipomoea nil]|uniref:binding partner of ACD11 1-like n=1 Tax=Ipomoea nil TaxID=35883 RepID=UPI000901ED44|nr:PREDICTED: binding partner of ACD11 1-like [Ipomoea nil]XP_019157110.1 PREDICTED: binding partner of ACD11 1-like [Ipomoea nil]
MIVENYTVEVTGLSPNASDKEVYEFFSYCGDIEHLEIIRLSDYVSLAYVTFKEAYGVETALLLSGSAIVDQCVRITRLEDKLDAHDPFFFSRMDNQSSSQVTHANEFVSTPGEAVTIAQQVVTTMIAKGYVLSKDALAKAKAFDEEHQVSSTAAAKVAELSMKIGLTDKINSGVEAVKSVDEKYHVSEITKNAASYTGKTAIAAAAAVVNSSYFAKGALWVSGVLDRAAKATADLGKKGNTMP